MAVANIFTRLKMLVVVSSCDSARWVSARAKSSQPETDAAESGSLVVSANNALANAERVSCLAVSSRGASSQIAPP